MGSWPRRIAAAGGRVASVAQRTLPVAVVMKLAADEGPNLAIVLAWNLLTSLFPIALALAAVLGVVVSHLGLGETAIYALTLSLFPTDMNAQSAAIQAVEQVRQTPGLLAWLALAGFLWTASNLFGAMELAFDRAYGVSPRPFPRQKAMALVMMLVFAVLALIGVGASAVVPLLSGVAVGSFHLPAEAGSTVIVQAGVGLTSAVTLFLILYVVVPNRPVHPREAWPGAVLGGVLFELLSLAFPLYAHANRGLTQYGRYFAFLFTLLAFFYLVGLILVIGVELNAVLARRRETKATAADR